MADISKITANGVTYDIKDSTARDDIVNINAALDLVAGNQTNFGSRIQTLESGQSTVSSTVTNHETRIEDVEESVTHLLETALTVTYANEELTIG